MKRTAYATASTQSSPRKPMRHFFAAAICAIAAAAIILSIASFSPVDNPMSKAAFGHTATQKAMVRAPHTSGLTTGTTGEKAAATVLVYLNGSDLESEAGEATADIAEMLESGIGSNVNVVIETLGTRNWQNYGIANDHTQRYIVSEGELKLVDDSLGQLDTTAPETLADFISWGVQNYPADRYMLVMWDHGGGPVYGFGYDEFQSDYAALTLDEIQEALEANAKVHFDFIGMDCCIMSSIETCHVLAPFCDYAILSEDFEPGIGWSYTNWMSKLEQNPSISTVELGTAIVDDMVAAVSADPENGDATLALIDESAVDALYKAWVDFAYENKDALLNTNYSQEITQHGREGFEDETARPGGHGHGNMNPSGDSLGYGMDANGYDAWGGQDDWGDSGDWGDGNSSGDSGDWGDWGDGNSWGDSDDWGDWGDLGGWDDWGGYGFDSWGSDMSYVTMSDYFVTDIMAVASTIDSDKTTALKTAMDNAIVHYSRTEGDASMAGISVTLPYGDAEFYDELVKVFSACEIDNTYIEWLNDFVEAEGADNYYDFSGFDSLDMLGGPDYGFGSYDELDSGFEGNNGGFGGFGETGNFDEFYGFDGSGSEHDSPYGFGATSNFDELFGFDKSGSILNVLSAVLL